MAEDDLAEVVKAAPLNALQNDQIEKYDQHSTSGRREQRSVRGNGLRGR